MEKKEVKFSIKLAVSDMFHFMMRHTYTSFSGLFGVVISVGALVMLALTFKSNDTMTNGVLAAIGVLFLIVNPLMIYFKASQQIKKSPVFQKPLDYEFGDEKIKVSQDDQELEFNWEDIRKIVETNRLIIVYLSSVRAYILPKAQYENDYENLKQIFNQKMNPKLCKWKKG